MLKKVSILISIVALGIFVGCVDPVTTSTNVPPAEDGIKDLNKTLPMTSVWKDTITLTSDTDTFKATIPLIKGNSYVARNLSGNLIIGTYISPNGDMLFFVNEFGLDASSNGDIYVSFYGGTSETYPRTCIFEIKTLDQGGSKYLDGNWIVSKREQGAFGVKQAFTHSEKECYEYVTIRNDSVFSSSVSYNWSGMKNIYSDTILTDRRSIAHHKYFKYPFSHNGDIFVTGGKSTAGYYYLTIKKTSTPLSAITSWKTQLFDPTAEGLIGTWYCSADYWHEQKMKNGILLDETEDSVYASPAVSKKIFDIRKDSVIVYEKGENSMSTSKYIYSKAAWACHYVGYLTLSKLGNAFSIEEAGGASNIAFHTKTTYTKFTGAVPPAEWPKLNNSRKQTEDSSKRQRFSLLR